MRLDDDEVLALLSELISICRETNENTKKILITKAGDSIDPIEKSFVEEARRRLERRMVVLENLADAGTSKTKVDLDAPHCPRFPKALEQLEKDGLIQVKEKELGLTTKGMDKSAPPCPRFSKALKQLEKAGLIQVKEETLGLTKKGMGMAQTSSTPRGTRRHVVAVGIPMDGSTTEPLPPLD